MGKISKATIPNPATQLNVIRRYLHILALLQNNKDPFDWNGSTLADVLSFDEDSSVVLADKTIREYIKKFLKDELGIDFLIEKGARRTELVEPIEEKLLFNLASIYLSFVVKDSSRENVLKRLIEKHPQDCLWLLGRLYFAILMKHKIKFKYIKQLAPMDEPREYFIHPYHIVLKNNNLYLIGKSGNSGTIVLFIVNKIESLKVTDETFSEDVLSVNEYFKDTLGSFIGSSNQKYKVKLRINKEYFRHVDEIINSLEPVYKEINAGKDVLAIFDLSDDIYFCKQIFPFGKFVEIVEPADLRQIMIDLLKESIEMYS